MIVYRCDVCHANVQTKEHLENDTVVVRIGNTYLLNLPAIDRCYKCTESISTALTTACEAIDDTGTHNDRTQPTIDPARIDALHAHEAWTEKDSAAAEKEIDIMDLLEDVSTEVHDD